MLGFHRTQPIEETADAQAARGLGWASIGIGLTEILAPQRLQRLMGLRNDAQNTGILRVLGVREICHGVDILAHRDPTPGVASRIAGDMLDGVLLAAAAKRTRRPGGLATVAALVLPIVIFDVLFGERLRRRREE